MNDGFTRNAVQPAIMKNDRIMPYHRLVIMPQILPRYAAHLKDIHEVGFIRQLNDQLKLLKIEILKREIIKERVRREKLLTADVNRVFRNLIRVARGALAGGQFDLRS